MYYTIQGPYNVKFVLFYPSPPSCCTWYKVYCTLLIFDHFSFKLPCKKQEEQCAGFHQLRGFQQITQIQIIYCERICMLYICIHMYISSWAVSKRKDFFRMFCSNVCPPPIPPTRRLSVNELVLNSVFGAATKPVNSAATIYIF